MLLRTLLSCCSLRESERVHKPQVLGHSAPPPAVVWSSVEAFASWGKLMQ